jgi:transposase
VRELAGDDAGVTPLVEPLLAILATMLRELARLTRQVLDIVRHEQTCRRLMSVPGVGPITALAFGPTKPSSASARNRYPQRQHEMRR